MQNPPETSSSSNQPIQFLLWHPPLLYSIHQNDTQQPSVNALTQCLEDMLWVPRRCTDLSHSWPPWWMPQHKWNMVTAWPGVGSHGESCQIKCTNLHLYITSQPKVDIQTYLEPLTSTTNHISLHNEIRQRTDVVEFVRVVVYSDKNTRQW